MIAWTVLQTAVLQLASLCNESQLSYLVGSQGITGTGKF